MKQGIIIWMLLSSFQLFGQVENCVNLNGIDQYILIGDTGNLGVSDFTLEIWFNNSVLTNSGQKLINKGLTTFGNPSNAGYGLRVGVGFEDEIEFLIGNSDGNLGRLTFRGIQEGMWHHVAGVKSGTNLLLYLDGVLVAEENIESIFNVDNDVPLAIGALDRGNNLNIDEFFNGKIDEVRIWNSARSENEIVNDMNCAIDEAQDNLIAVYNFDVESGEIAIDNSGFNQDGQLINGIDWINSEVALNCVNNIEESDSKNIKSFPNPFSDKIFLERSVGFDKYCIYDLSGKVVKESTNYNGEINTLNLPSGAYFLEIYYDGELYTNKIVKY